MQLTPNFLLAAQSTGATPSCDPLLLAVRVITSHSVVLMLDFEGQSKYIPEYERYIKSLGVARRDILYTQLKLYCPYQSV